MNSKIEQLASCSFAVLSARIAYMLRPDIWATRFNCGTDFNTSPEKLRKFTEARSGVKPYQLQLEGSPDWVIVAFRLNQALSERIEWITGLRVTATRPIADTSAQPAPTPTPKADDDGPPPNQSQARRDYFEALGIPDPVYREPSRFAPKRSSL